MSENEFVKDIEINEDQLDKECVQHPKKYLKYSELLSYSIAEYDLEKDNYQILLAKIDTEVRKALTESGTKMTEAIVQAHIQKSEERIEASIKLIEKKKGVDMLRGAVAAFEHRKVMLAKLADLWISGYFSAPKTDKSIKDRVINNANKNIREKLNQ